MAAIPCQRTGRRRAPRVIMGAPSGVRPQRARWRSNMRQSRSQARCSPSEPVNVNETVKLRDECAAACAVASRAGSLIHTAFGRAWGFGGPWGIARGERRRRPRGRWRRIRESRLMQHGEHLGPLLGRQGPRLTASSGQPLLRPQVPVGGGSPQAHHLASRHTQERGVQPLAAQQRSRLTGLRAAVRFIEDAPLVLRRESTTLRLLHHLGLPNPSLFHHRIHRPCLGRPAH